MAFPGDHKVVQFARGVEADFDSIVLEEGEIVIMLAVDPDDMQIRLGDGETLGGTIFVSKAYVDTVAGNAGIDEGTDVLAAAGTDLEQRSWPATSFGLKAPINSPVFTGTPAGPTPAGSEDSTRLSTTAWVKDRLEELVSQTTNADETVFPIGHILVAEINGNNTNRNAIVAATLRLNTGNSQDYILGGAGTAIAGTWRSRGRIVIAGASFILLQRVA